MMGNDKSNYCFNQIDFLLIIKLAFTNKKLRLYRY